MLTRNRFVVPRRLLPSVMLLAQSPEKRGAIPGDTYDELRRTGLISPDNTLTETAATVVATMTEASLVSSVDVRFGEMTTSSTIWATNATAALGRQIDEELCELTPLRTSSLPVVVAQLVDIGRRPAPPFFGSGALADAALAMALDRTSTASDDAVDILMAAGLERTWADRLLIAHQHMRSRWSISSVWSSDDGGHHVRFVSVLDGGSAGYWRIEPLEVDPPASRYSVITLEQVMRLLRSALPVLGRLDA